MTTPTYATGTDFAARYDVRLVGDLVSDTGSAVQPVDLPTNTNLLAMLSDAYGKIVSTIVVGDRYTLAQIDPAAIAPSGAAFLMRLQCDLALLYLKRRRGKFNAKADADLLKDTNEALAALQDGAAILLGILDANAQASVAGMAQPELIPLSQRNTIRFTTRNYFPLYPYNGRSRPYTSGGN